LGISLGGSNISFAPTPTWMQWFQQEGRVLPWNRWIQVHGK